MGLFNMFGRRNNDKDNTNNDIDKIEVYRNIVKLIDTNGVVSERLNKCFDDPKAYFNEYRDNYDDRCMEEVERDDFVYCIKGILGDKSLPIEETWFDEEEEFTQWATILNEKWAASGYVLADMDIDSDSYCVFITDMETYEKLVTEARKAGQRIDLAQNM